MEINKYYNGKIYQIVSFSHPELVYYGSTIQSLSNRMCCHRKNYKQGYYVSSSELFKYDDVKILLIENYKCNNREELNKREGEYIRNNECVNKVIAGRTQRQWKEDNNDAIKEYAKKYSKKYKENNTKLLQENAKKYYDDNKEQKIEKAKKYYDDNKEQKIEKAKKYYDDNKDAKKIYAKIRYQVNKEYVSKRNAEIIKCECGLEITKNYKLRHTKTSIHKNNLEKLKNL
jgi:hypothetical protein